MGQVKLQDQTLLGLRIGRLSYPEKERWAALADGPECAPRLGLWVVSCVCALFLRPVCSTVTENTFSMCVNEGTVF